MTTTLITFLGGHGGKEQSQLTYARAQYRFPDQSIVESAYFGEAVLSSGCYEIGQVLIFGSRTSIWEYLVQDMDEDLFFEIHETTDGKNAPGISDELLRDIEKKLMVKWKLPFLLYAGDSVTQMSAASEFMGYEQMLAKIPEDHQVLLDFTHGFRSMPVLLMSALRFRAALQGQENMKNIQLIYGELRQGEPSPVHGLDEIWRGLKVAQAARLFFEKFEGHELAQELEPFWKNGAVAIRQFSDAVQNYIFYKTDDHLRALQNALQKYPDEAPPWLLPVKRKLLKLVQQLLKEKRSLTMLELSRLLYQNHLLGQAFLALDEALLECILMAHNKQNADMKYADLEDLRRSALIPHDHKFPSLKHIAHYRNLFAHGRRNIQHKPLPESPNKAFMKLVMVLHPFAVDPNALIMTTSTTAIESENPQ